MLELLNESPWAASLAPGWDRQRRFAMTLVVKARFGFDAAGALEARAAPAIEPADRHHGDPARTSLARAGEAVAFKEGADCLFHGTAKPGRHGQRAREILVRVEAGEAGFTKRLRVTGRRTWRRTGLGLVASQADPLQPTPLQYEYAFGGVDVRSRELEPRNPVGMGFGATKRALKGQELPRIEYRDSPITRWSQRPAPAGLGPLPAGWEPRRRLTMDLDTEAAARGGCPYPREPAAALFNAAPIDQRLPAPIAGGERVHLAGFGLAADLGMLTLAVPRPSPRARLIVDGRASDLALACDTLEIDADAGTLDLLFRATTPVARDARSAGWVVLKDAAAEAA